MTDPRTTIGEAQRIAALWTGLLLAPVAFLVNLELGYALVRHACRTDSLLAVHAVHLGCLLLALVGVLIAYRTRRSADELVSAGDERAVRTRFMGGLGVTVGLLFAFVILSQWVPGFVLSPCQ
jgi:uncharacterized protein YacL